MDRSRKEERGNKQMERKGLVERNQSLRVNEEGRGLLWGEEDRVKVSKTEERV